MHKPGHIRDKFEEAIARSKNKWWDGYEKPAKENALKNIGELWNCTDTVPSPLREDVVEWLETDYIDPYEAANLRRCATYAQLIRRLKQTL